MVQVSELKGFKSLKALNAFHSLLLGLKMLPNYMAMDYETFLASVDSMPRCDQEKMIREAVMFIELQKDEVEAMIGFCKDANGVPYSPENMKNLKPDELVEIIVAVSMAIADMKINFVTEKEKKN